jgi:3',5'-cyclic AMP phosphodiesterase CpdA
VSSAPRTVVLVSDTHLSSKDRLLVENWSATARWIELARPDLVVHLGDITANGAHEDGELVFAREVFRQTGTDVCFLPGNHDIGDHAPGPTPGLDAEHPFDPVRLDEFRALFGPDRWALDLGGWRLIGLNAPLMGTGLPEEAAQSAWLAQALRGHAGPLGVFLHKPLFRDALDEDEVHTRYVPRPARQALMAALAGCELRFVAAGHTHQVRKVVRDGVEHVWAPSTAFTVPDFRQEIIGEKLVGVMTLHLSDAGHSFSHIIPAGMKPHSLMAFEHIYPALAEVRPPAGQGPA